MSSPVDPASRLAFHVKWRRGNLGLNQMEVWAAGGPSNTTLTDIENNRLKTLTNATAKKLDKGLQWKPGSAMAVWQSDVRPVALDGSVGGKTHDEPGYVESPGDRASGGLAEDAVLRKFDEMSDAIREMSERLARLEEERRS